MLELHKGWVLVQLSWTGLLSLQDDGCSNVCVPLVGLIGINLGPDVVRLLEAAAPGFLMLSMGLGRPHDVSAKSLVTVRILGERGFGLWGVRRGDLALWAELETMGLKGHVKAVDKDGRVVRQS